VTVRFPNYQPREASVEISERCRFRLPLRRSKLSAEPRQPLGPSLLFGLERARGVGEQQLTELVEQALPARFAETGRSEPSEAVLERAKAELRTICGSDLADLLLFAHDVSRFCADRGIPLAARGSVHLEPGRLGTRAIRVVPARLRTRQPHVLPRRSR
jgi:DNA polymerase III alpha subunit